MAVSPILLNSLPFDALYEHTLQFRQSGNQIFAHRVIIKDNETNIVVYDQKTDAMNTIIKIPANTLTNGKWQNYQVSVFDRDGNESPFSNIVILLCIKTPTFYFSNIQNDMLIKNSSIDAELEYQQENGEELNAYRVLLYADNSTSIVFDSGVKQPNGDIIITIPNLSDDTTYYIQATGSTVNGMEIKTEKIRFAVKYIKPDVFLTFRADNVPEEGVVRLTSNFISIEGSSDPKDIQFIEDEKVVIGLGEKVYFDKGFSFKDFFSQIIAENIPDFSKIVTFDIGNSLIEITWNYGFFDTTKTKQYYTELIVTEKNSVTNLRYIQASNRIPNVLPSDQIMIQIKRSRNTYTLKIEKLGGDA